MLKASGRGETSHLAVLRLKLSTRSNYKRRGFQSDGICIRDAFYEASARSLHGISTSVIALDKTVNSSNA